MYFMICKAVDMALQPIRCLWSGDNKHFWKKEKRKKEEVWNDKIFLQFT